MLLPHLGQVPTISPVDKYFRAISEQYGQARCWCVGPMVNIPGLPAGAFDATQTDWQPVHITALRWPDTADGFDVAQPASNIDIIERSINFFMR